MEVGFLIILEGPTLSVKHNAKPTFPNANPSTVPSMQSTLFLPHFPVGWALLRGFEKPQNWIVAGQEGDVLKPNRLTRFG